MNKLYPLLLEHHLPVAVRYVLAGIIMLICAILQIALQLLTGYPGYFLLLPGVFVSGLFFDRGSGVLAASLAVVAGAHLSYGMIRVLHTFRRTFFSQLLPLGPHWSLSSSASR